MIAAGVDPAAANPPGAFDAESVGACLDLGAEGAKPFDGAGDPVRFLVAEFGRVGDDGFSLGEATERATSGSSSIARGMSAAPTSAPSRRVWLAQRVPKGSGPASPIRSTASPSEGPSEAAPIGTPIRARIERRPILVWFRPTSRSSISLPGTIRAAARGNAAEEKSPGTEMSRRRGPRLVRSSPRFPCARSAIPPPPASARCDRERRRLANVVGPSARSPASRRHDFTWALATGSS